MTTDLPTPRVDAQWLRAHLNAPDVRVADATWYLPTVDRDGAVEFAAGHIPGAVHFDFDAIADKSSDLPHMLPTPEQFAEQVGALGLGSDHAIIVYDTNGLFAAPRVWWMLRAMGHERVAVLEGGLTGWQAAGGAIETGAASPSPAIFTARRRSDLIRSRRQMAANQTSHSEQVVDARAPGRFAGAEPEPRPGLRAGHIPGAINLPFSQVLDSQTARLRSADAIRSAFAEAGVDLARPVTTSCGSGVSACILALALASIGRDIVAVYDGSWTEWGGSDLPLATGA
ncbi:MAG: 3-mercaptopyruvate sulfurtransferase [Alphaproteobacteria bacterium]